MSDEGSMSPDAYGRSLRGFGVNLLVRAIGPALEFQKTVLGTRLVHRTPDFAILNTAPCSGSCMPIRPTPAIRSPP